MPKVKDFVFVKSPRGITAVREERKILRNKNRIIDDMEIKPFQMEFLPIQQDIYLIFVLEIWTNTARQLEKSQMNYPKKNSITLE